MLDERGVRFTVPVLTGMIFIRYPIDVLPPEGTVGFVNNATWQTGAVFRDGCWRGMRGAPFKREPTHWTAFEEGKPDEKIKA